MKALGNHLLIEFYNCNQQTINDLKRIECILTESAIISGAEVVKSSFHNFSPHGISGVVLIAESHFSIHSWPEYGYCAVDIFTCGDKIDSEKALNYLKRELAASAVNMMEIKRGVLDIPPTKLKHKPDG